MDGGQSERFSLLTALNLTVRRLFCIISESIFLVGGIIIGYLVLPSLVEAMGESEFAPDPIVVAAMDWYWILLAILAAHILLWPIVPRFLGWFGVALWWALGVALPVLIVAVPGLFVMSTYINIIRDL